MVPPQVAVEPLMSGGLWVQIVGRPNSASLFPQGGDSDAYCNKEKGMDVGDCYSVGVDAGFHTIGRSFYLRLRARTSNKFGLLIVIFSPAKRS